jgi:pyrimidine oxygenase
MEYGLFIPIANNGWIISTTSPKYMPTFDLNRQICQNAEAHGFSFALSMIKYRGFGGATNHWDYALESFTLMAGLAAATNTMKLYASVATPTIHPAIVARMATTIDSIAPGRFGVNIVTGWQKAEFAQMGLWPGDDYYGYRYDYAEEYVTILRELWTTGRSDFKGKYFQLDDCVCLPRPSEGNLHLIGAGSSARGRAFAAQYCDINFTSSHSLDGIRSSTADLKAETDRTGRDVATYPLYMVILGETDEEAQAKVDLYNSGLDHEAVLAFQERASLDKSGATSARIASHITQSALSGPSIVGSPETVASRLNELSEIDGVRGTLLMFDDFLEGVDVFGKRVMPLLH